ncbi:hypothetical protein G7Y89_g3696 [Cudoniella acicularis]|uniref:Uncharacterized protein n=1 Tax=Cudoniella acicularis TaxID=354080 RepID=A0A8H4RSR3_9HELO|nr:hypothetical protein G7Y89_g3696 [Cudoniella acicularis]
MLFESSKPDPMGWATMNETFEVQPPTEQSDDHAEGETTEQYIYPDPEVATSPRYIYTQEADSRRDGTVSRASTRSSSDSWEVIQLDSPPISMPSVTSNHLLSPTVGTSNEQPATRRDAFSEDKVFLDGGENETDALVGETENALVRSDGDDFALFDDSSSDYDEDDDWVTDDEQSLVSSPDSDKTIEENDDDDKENKAHHPTIEPFPPPPRVDDDEEPTTPTDNDRQKPPKCPHNPVPALQYPRDPIPLCAIHCRTWSGEPAFFRYRVYKRSPLARETTLVGITKTGVTTTRLRWEVHGGKGVQGDDVIGDGFNGEGRRECPGCGGKMVCLWERRVVGDGEVVARETQIRQLGIVV